MRLPSWLGNAIVPHCLDDFPQALGHVLNRLQGAERRALRFLNRYILGRDRNGCDSELYANPVRRARNAPRTMLGQRTRSLVSPPLSPFLGGFAIESWPAWSGRLSSGSKRSN